MPMSMKTRFPIGAVLGLYHTIEAFLGEGAFGCVTKCHNKDTNTMEAVKVNSGNESIRQAKSELNILNRLSHLDADHCNIVKFNGHFLHGNNLCLRFELLNQSLHDYLRCRDFHGLPLSEVKSVLYQLANALFHLQSAGIIHADLKPQNIMVVKQEDKIKVKVIDFGLAQLVSETNSETYVQSLPYTAPEILLDTPFNEAIDMWTLGLIAVEMAVGRPMYPAPDPYNMLKNIISTQGPIPDEVLDRGDLTEEYFKPQNSCQQRWTLRSPDEVFYCDKGAGDKRHYTLGSLDDLQSLIATKTGNHSDLPLLVDLIKRMLQLDPDQRIQPMDVLNHPFFADYHHPDHPDHPDTCSGATGVSMTDLQATEEPSADLGATSESLFGNDGGDLLEACNYPVIASSCSGSCDPHIPVEITTEHYQNEDKLSIEEPDTSSDLASEQPSCGLVETTESGPTTDQNPVVSPAAQSESDREDLHVEAPDLPIIAPTSSPSTEPTDVPTSNLEKAAEQELSTEKEEDLPVNPVEDTVSIEIKEKDNPVPENTSSDVCIQIEDPAVDGDQEEDDGCFWPIIRKIIDAFHYYFF